MSKLSISLEWFLQEDELKPDVFSKNHKIEINNIILMQVLPQNMVEKKMN